MIILKFARPSLCGFSDTDLCAGDLDLNLIKPFWDIPKDFLGDSGKETTYIEEPAKR